MHYVGNPEYCTEYVHLLSPGEWGRSNAKRGSFLTPHFTPRNLPIIVLLSRCEYDGDYGSKTPFSEASTESRPVVHQQHPEL